MTGRVPTAADLIPRRARCGSCPATVVWAVTANRRAIPVNPTPSATGNLLLELQTITPDEAWDKRENEQLVAHTLRRNQILGALADGQQLYTTHFADCPRATEHRRPRR